MNVLVTIIGPHRSHLFRWFCLYIFSFATIFTTLRTSVRVNQGLCNSEILEEKRNGAVPIRQISILGERNSGTRWIYNYISGCFNHSLEVNNNFTRYKHWFQHQNTSAYKHNTLVLAQFRNPYVWLKAMQHVPHHAPAHLRTHRNATVHQRDAGNDWKIFLTKSWTTERVGLDLEIKGNPLCRDNFRFKDLVSCHLEPLPASYYQHKLRYSENEPFYEMRNDGSGKPYDNILEMRTDKIRNFLSVANFEGVAGLWTLQYDFLLANGTETLLNRIEKWTGVAPACDPIGPQNRPEHKGRKISPQFAEHVRKNLDWSVERKIGYDVEWWREQR